MKITIVILHEITEDIVWTADIEAGSLRITPATINHAGKLRAHSSSGGQEIPLKYGQQIIIHPYE